MKNHTPKIGNKYQIVRQITLVYGNTTQNYPNPSFTKQRYEVVCIGFMKSKQKDIFFNFRNYEGYWLFVQKIHEDKNDIHAIPLGCCDLIDEAKESKDACICDITTLARQGCVCGSIKRYAP